MVSYSRQIKHHFKKSQQSRVLFCLCPKFFTGKTPFSLRSHKLSLVASQSSRNKCFLPFWVPRALLGFLLMGGTGVGNVHQPLLDCMLGLQSKLFCIK